jgi:hypothetical protein
MSSAAAVTTNKHLRKLKQIVVAGGVARAEAAARGAAGRDGEAREAGIRARVKQLVSLATVPETA